MLIIFDMCSEHILDKIDNILLKQNDITSNFELIESNLKILRNFCARGSIIQDQIASNKDFQDFLHRLLLTAKFNHIEKNEHLKTIAWQLMANMIVNNQQSQSLLWRNHGNGILHYLSTERKLNKNVDVVLMILYNSMKSPSIEYLFDISFALKSAIHVWKMILDQKYSEEFEFLHFIFEEFLVNNGRNTVKYYVQLDTNERLNFLDYLICYLRQDNPNGLVHDFLIQHISKEFKIKSDCILRIAELQEVDSIKPQEVHSLLRCIASATGLESYSHIYQKDHSLFLNLSSILRLLVAVTKDGKNKMFSPMNKLEEVAPASLNSMDYQSEISFELKTLLVRCIANLLYNNSTNKRYCLDTQLLPALFECTNMDARNPLMREWSILAIRNACIGCPEIQETVANLTQLGFAKNDILSQLNLHMGSLRINPSK